MKKQPKYKPGAGKSWKEKLTTTHPNHGKIVRATPAMRKRLRANTILIPEPKKVDAAVRQVRKGKLSTLSQLRQRLAEEAGAEASCPLTTGIFLRIVAEAAEEDRDAGRTRLSPYWRIIRDDGRLMDKFPGGPAAQARKLREEGFAITKGRSGKILRVEDFASFLIR